jgi:hypothetical protein
MRSAFIIDSDFYTAPTSHRLWRAPEADFPPSYFWLRRPPTIAQKTNSAIQRGRTPSGRLHRSHGDAIERLGDRESIRIPQFFCLHPFFFSAVRRICRSTHRRVCGFNSAFFSLFPSEADRPEFRGERLCLLGCELDQWRPHRPPPRVVCVDRDGLFQRRDHGRKLSATEHLTHDI